LAAISTQESALDYTVLLTEEQKIQELMPALAASSLREQLTILAGKILRIYLRIIEQILAWLSL
jgi:hypothetical protein